MNLAKKVVVGVIASFLVFQSAALQSGFAATYEQYPVSSGVKYKENREVINGYDQSIKVLEVNLQDPYTQLNLSVPKIGTISGTTAQAKLVHREGNRVVGAVNGSFFDTKTKLPMYLIAQNDTLVNSGIIASGRDQYVNEPIAFGINASRKAMIDYFDLDLSAAHNGTAMEITSVNKVRTENNLILFTPEYGQYTNSNQYGMEVIFTGASKNNDLKFGDKITGTVSSIRPYGTTTNTQIPADGFVLSAHGTENLQFLKGMNIGEQVEVSINIDDKWKGAQYILASGPRLVDNGAVSLSIDPKSSRATERAPRTAIAVDRTLTKVFMVTVDGRAAGYSKGMNLTEFAQYLVKLGAYKALNLDGGGSTTMLARKYGNDMASLVNKPSDGWERAVHTSLQAISTAPIGTESSFAVGVSSSSVTIGESITVSLKYVLDQFYNPLAKDPAKLKLSSTLGSFEGTTLKTTKTGDGVIVATYGNLPPKEIPIKVTAVASPFSDVPSTSKYYPQIKYLYDRDIIAGYADGTYRPATTLKRLDAALLLVRALKLDTANITDVNFVDVPKEYRFYKEIAAITNAGIINGKEGGTKFDPNAPLTRAEMAAILERAFKLQPSGEMPFTDVPPSSFAYKSVLSLYANDITKGYGTEYRPNESVDRIQYALFLYRAVTR